MDKLIKNELKKIFKKKVLYILLIILIGICILVNVMDKMFEKDSEYYNEREKKYNQEGLENARANGDSEYERNCKSYLEAYELAKKYEPGSWQRYIIQNEVEQVIKDMLRTKSGEGYDFYKEEYDRLLKLIESDNWRGFVEEKIENIDSQLAVASDEEYAQTLKYQKQALEWRLEKNIAYGNTPLNVYLATWENAKILETEFQKINNPTRDEKKSIEKNTATIKICEYAIENNINANIINTGTLINEDLQYNLTNDARSSLLEVMVNFGFFIFLATILIAGGIVSDEFNKGTIKLLLVRPYARTKILMSKFLTCLIILAISIVTLITVQTIVGGIVYGFGSYGNETVVYDYTTNNIKTMGTIQAVGEMIFYLLPKFLLVFTIAFTLSTVATNSVISIAVPMIIIMEELFLNMLATTVEKAKFLIYFITPNWDLSQYAHGATSQLKELTPMFSITICTIYFIGLLAISIRTFNKKNIKNI